MTHEPRTRRRVGPRIGQRIATVSRLGSYVIAAAIAMTSTGVAAAQQTALPVPDSYADVADFAVQSATIIDATIKRTREVEPTRAIGVPAHLVRLYVEADVQSVIYGREVVAIRIAYLTDQPRQTDGRPPRLRRMRVLLFARPVAVTNQVQLVQPNAQLGWSAAREVTARTIARELARGSVPPQITGVAQAFHVAGTVAGESETQIFLLTAIGQPVSLSILRRPGQQPRWAAAFGEIVDESAAVPPRYTLPWYRLACGLPDQLPRSTTQTMTEQEATTALADYALVRRDVGPCDRTPAPAVVPPEPTRRP